MKVDAKITTSGPSRPTGLRGLADLGRRAEQSGYDGIWSTESAHDPFLPLVPVAQATTGIEVGTAIAVAFSRTPMSLAYTAHDLQTLTGGRFLLGLGSQVRPHIERRFAMPWSRPAARMREFVLALRAIWAAWNHAEPLDFRGEFYTHTLMTPFFSPEPCSWGAPKVYLAAVGDRMTEVAGAVCDGLQPHPFTTRRYLRERTVPTVARGRSSAGRGTEDFSLSLAGLVVSGRTEEEMAAADRAVRQQIAFYASTPAYRPVLDLHGWGELGVEANALSRSADEQRWVRMGELVDDEILHAFAVVAEPDGIGPAVRARYGDLIDRFTFYAPYPHDPELWQPAVQDLRGIG